MKIIFGLVVTLTLIIPVTVLSQTEMAESRLNTASIAENMKYRNALGFMEINDYSRALNEFNEYLEIYINGIYRDRVYRKIAEIHISRFDYLKAVNAYKSLYQEFSYSEEGIDAFFRAGICYKKMGYDQKAKEIFRYIIEKHPGTNAAFNADIQFKVIDIISE